MDWLVPYSTKEVLLFLGFANFYCCFIHGYRVIAAPLLDLTKKDTAAKFLIKGDALEAFHKL
jgi:hypothetical protein